MQTNATFCNFNSWFLLYLSFCLTNHNLWPNPYNIEFILLQDSRDFVGILRDTGGGACWSFRALLGFQTPSGSKQKKRATQWRHIRHFHVICCRYGHPSISSLINSNCTFWILKHEPCAIFMTYVVPHLLDLFRTKIPILWCLLSCCDLNLWFKG